MGVSVCVCVSDKTPHIAHNKHNTIQERTTKTSQAKDRKVILTEAKNYKRFPDRRVNNKGHLELEQVCGQITQRDGRGGIGPNLTREGVAAQHEEPLSELRT